MRAGLPHARIKRKVYVRRGAFDAWMEKQSGTVDIDKLVDEIVESVKK
jgi:hypothetical protein